MKIGFGFGVLTDEATVAAAGVEDASELNFGADSKSARIGSKVGGVSGVSRLEMTCGVLESIFNINS